MPSVIKSSLAVDPAQFRGQRHSARTEVNAAGVLFPEDSRTPGQTVMVTDVSLRGIGFQCPSCLRIGSTHRIDAHLGSLHLASRLQVMRCNQREGAYEIGADFIDD